MELYDNEIKKASLFKSALECYYENSSKSILEKAADHLTDNFRRAQRWRFDAYDAGIIRRIPTAVRGNAVYAYFQEHRLDSLQRQLDKRLITNGSTRTNILFTTHTLKYKKNDLKDVMRVWKEGEKALEPFMRRMRGFGMVDYCLAIESFKGAGFHIHIASIFDRELPMKKTVKYIRKKKKEPKKRKIIYRLTDSNLVCRIRKAWAKSAGKPVHEAHSDIECCYSKGLAGYLVKELKKVSCAEYALKQYRKGKANDNAKKKIIAFYMADLLKIRMLRVSQGLSSVDEGERQIVSGQDDLIKDLCNKSTSENPDEKPVRLFSLVLSRSQLYEVVKFDEFEPWTGLISFSDPHYGKIRDLFDRVYNYSEILRDKERLKALIAERKRQYKEKKKKKEEALALIPVQPVIPF